LYDAGKEGVRMPLADANVSLALVITIVAA